MEDNLDCDIEEPRQFEGKREARIEFCGFNGVDGLAGDFQEPSGIGLCPLCGDGPDVGWGARNGPQYKVLIGDDEIELCENCGILCELLFIHASG
jgi:hypothetical protein